VNVVIAAVLLLWLGTSLDPQNLTAIENPTVSLAAKLAGANIVLVLFNMIPAFPMDGGRVLRALLAMHVGNARATELAASIGQGFAVVFGILGIFYNPMLIIIAVFIFLAASGEAGPGAASRRGARGACVGCHDYQIPVARQLGEGWRRCRRADSHHPDGISHRG
jgi:Zn-dependent protease